MSNQVLRLGVIGLGQRGHVMVEGVLPYFKNIEVTAVCDIYEDRIQRAQDCTVNHGGKKPFGTKDYQEVIARSDVDAVLISSAWESHVKIAVDSMKAGKPVGMEVGGAYSIDDCWLLVRTSEETGVPCMMLENCCYARTEMMVLNMAKQGLFGDIIYCTGGYKHDLRREIANGVKIRHYRLRNYLSRNCDNYPTHQLGPIAQLLDINHGNRMVSLVSVSSCSKGLKDFVRRNPEYDQSILNKDVTQGDVVTTIIKCAKGQTITLTLDTTLPRPYSRGFEVHGTRGLFMEDNGSVFLEDDFKNFGESSWKEHWGNMDKYMEKYEHPVWKQYREDGVLEGHGGADGLVIKAFADSVLNQTPPPIDVYDAAAWMSITALSEASIASGSPVAIPDFTNGEWLLR